MTFLTPFKELIKYNENIGIKLTERFDVALVMYLMAQTIDEQRKYHIEIYPYSASFTHTSDYSAMIEVRKFICDKFPKVKIHDIEYFEFDLKNYTTYSRNIWMFWDWCKKDMKEKYNLNIHLDGRSKNFPVQTMVDMGYSSRHLEKDFDYSHEEKNYTQYDSPFHYLTRKEIGDLYKELGLYNTLLQLTRNCNNQDYCEKCDKCIDFKLSFGATFSEYIQSVPSKSRIRTQYNDTRFRDPNVLDPRTLLD